MSETIFDNPYFILDLELFQQYKLKNISQFTELVSTYDTLDPGIVKVHETWYDQTLHTLDIFTNGGFMRYYTRMRETDYYRKTIAQLLIRWNNYRLQMLRDDEYLRLFILNRREQGDEQTEIVLAEIYKGVTFVITDILNELSAFVQVQQTNTMEPVDEYLKYMQDINASRNRDSPQTQITALYTEYQKYVLKWRQQIAKVYKEQSVAKQDVQNQLEASQQRIQQEQTLAVQTFQGLSGELASTKQQLDNTVQQFTELNERYQLQQQQLVRVMEEYERKEPPPPVEYPVMSPQHQQLVEDLFNAIITQFPTTQESFRLTEQIQEIRVYLQRPLTQLEYQDAIDKLLDLTRQRTELVDDQTQKQNQRLASETYTKLQFRLKKLKEQQTQLLDDAKTTEQQKTALQKQIDDLQQRNDTQRLLIEEIQAKQPISEQKLFIAKAQAKEAQRREQQLQALLIEREAEWKSALDEATQQYIAAGNKSAQEQQRLGVEYERLTDRYKTSQNLRAQSDLKIDALEDKIRLIGQQQNENLRLREGIAQKEREITSIQNLLTQAKREHTVTRTNQSITQAREVQTIIKQQAEIASQTEQLIAIAPESVQTTVIQTVTQIVQQQINNIADLATQTDIQTHDKRIQTDADNRNRELELASRVRGLSKQALFYEEILRTVGEMNTQLFRIQAAATDIQNSPIGIKEMRELYNQVEILYRSIQPSTPTNVYRRIILLQPPLDSINPLEWIEAIDKTTWSIQGAITQDFSTVSKMIQQTKEQHADTVQKIYEDESAFASEISMLANTKTALIRAGEAVQLAAAALRPPKRYSKQNLQIEELKSATQQLQDIIQAYLTDLQASMAPYGVNVQQDIHLFTLAFMQSRQLDNYKTSLTDAQYETKRQELSNIMQKVQHDLYSQRAAQALALHEVERARRDISSNTTLRGARITGDTTEDELRDAQAQLKTAEDIINRLHQQLQDAQKEPSIPKTIPMIKDMQLIRRMLGETGQSTKRAVSYMRDIFKLAPDEQELAEQVWHQLFQQSGYPQYEDPLRHMVLALVTVVDLIKRQHGLSQEIFDVYLEYIQQAIESIMIDIRDLYTDDAPKADPTEAGALAAVVGKTTTAARTATIVDTKSKVSKYADLLTDTTERLITPTFKLKVPDTLLRDTVSERPALSDKIKTAGLGKIVRLAIAPGTEPLLSLVPAAERKAGKGKVLTTAKTPSISYKPVSDRGVPRDLVIPGADEKPLVDWTESVRKPPKSRATTSVPLDLNEDLADDKIGIDYARQFADYWAQQTRTAAVGGLPPAAPLLHHYPDSRFPGPKAGAPAPAPVLALPAANPATAVADAARQLQLDAQSISRAVGALTGGLGYRPPPPFVPSPLVFPMLIPGLGAYQLPPGYQPAAPPTALRALGPPVLNPMSAEALHQLRLMQPVQPPAPELASSMSFEQLRLSTINPSGTGVDSAGVREVDNRYEMAARIPGMQLPTWKRPETLPRPIPLTAQRPIGPTGEEWQRLTRSQPQPQPQPLRVWNQPPTTTTRQVQGLGQPGPLEQMAGDLTTQLSAALAPPQTKPAELRVYSEPQRVPPPPVDIDIAQEQPMRTVPITQQEGRLRVWDRLVVRPPEIEVVQEYRTIERPARQSRDSLLDLVNTGRSGGKKNKTIAKYGEKIKSAIDLWNQATQEVVMF